MRLFMKFLVTGGTGFVGSHLVDLLCEKGFEVICPVRSARSLRHLSPKAAAVIPLDTLEGYAISHGPFDYVIHVAGATRALTYEAYHDANVLFTSKLLRIFSREPLRSRLQRFIHISSQAVVGPSNDTDTPKEEDAPPAPISWYAHSKMEAEKAVTEAGQYIPVTIVRPSTVFGPRDADVLGVFKAVRWRIAPYIAGPDRFVSIIYVEDLTTGILAAALSPTSVGKTYFLTNTRPVIWREFVLQVADVCGTPGVSLPLPTALVRFTAFLGDTASRLAHRPLLIRSDKLQELLQTAWVCSPEKARRDFGWRARTPLEEAIRKTFEWYKTHGWL